MKNFFIALWSVLLCLACLPAAQAQQSSKPGFFDYYLLTLSWSPEFCHSHSDNPQCSRHDGFVMHGLWPQYINGKWPQYCSRASGLADPETMTDIMPDVHLVEHEWEKHGTCSGLSAPQYFNEVRTAFASVRIPQPLANPHHQQRFTPAQLKQMLVEANPQWATADVAIGCGNNYLTGVSVCMDRNLHSIACKAVHDCRANAVKIPPIR